MSNCCISPDQKHVCTSMVSNPSLCLLDPPKYKACPRNFQSSPVLAALVSIVSIILAPLFSTLRRHCNYLSTLAHHRDTPQKTRCRHGLDILHYKLSADPDEVDSTSCHLHTPMYTVWYSAHMYNLLCCMHIYCAACRSSQLPVSFSGYPERSQVNRGVNRVSTTKVPSAPLAPCRQSRRTPKKLM